MADHFGRAGLMAIAAFRYCLGRSSYIVGDCADWLGHKWPTLPPNVRTVIERDLREAIQRDDQSRQERDQHHPLGMDMDRRTWLGVMAMIEGHKGAA